MNLNALESRFLRICIRRVWSVSIASGTSVVELDREAQPALLGDAAERPLDVVADVGDALLG